ncbi:hypothetical protein BH11BAC6_BH11BAC6_16620 [soil metagenome]
MLFTCALFFYVGNAQHLTISADRNKILIGEQIVLQLKAEDINDRTTFLQGWFTLNESAGHIQVVKREGIDTIEINALTSYLQKITITSFDSGRWAIAMQPIMLQDRVSGKQSLLKTDSLYIDVLPVDVSALRDYHPEKEIIDITIKPDYTLYIIIAGAAVLFIVIVWLLVRHFRKKKVVTDKPTYKGTALDDALQQVQQLQQQNLPAKGEVKLFYTKLNDICRQYFSRQLGLHAHTTSDELMVTLIVYLQEEKRRTAFYQFLRLTDAVKFAKYNPDTSQHEEAVATVITSLKHIDHLIAQSKQHDQQVVPAY